MEKETQAKAKTKTIPTTLNMALAAAISLTLLLQLFFLPFLTDNIWIMLAVVIILIPLNTPYWSLIHEAIHGNLHPNRKANQTIARAMAILFGAGYPVLRFGHLMHHQYNREWESEYYDAQEQPRWRAALTHYFKMLGGLYLIEVAASFALSLSPSKIVAKAEPYLFEDERHRQAIKTALLKPENMRMLRMDCAAILVLYGLSFYLYGAHWFIPLAAIAGRAFIISLMDNAYHYDTPPDNSIVAHELSLPGPLEKFILYFNHHRTHHNHVTLPWSELKKAHQQDGEGYSLGLGKALAAQFKGPLEKP
ncbi:MAG: fatty acid desaturase [Micavibrio sp.]